MVDFVLAAEFDIKKGVCLKKAYPLGENEIENSYILASYMLPDGCHRHIKDISVFQSPIILKPINKEEAKAEAKIETKSI